MVLNKRFSQKMPNLELQENQNLVLFLKYIENKQSKKLKKQVKHLKLYLEVLYTSQILINTLVNFSNVSFKEH